MVQWRFDHKLDLSENNNADLILLGLFLDHLILPIKCFCSLVYCFNSFVLFVYIYVNWTSCLIILHNEAYGCVSISLFLLLIYIWWSYSFRIYFRIQVILLCLHYVVFFLIEKIVVASRHTFLVVLTFFAISHSVVTVV